MQSNRQPTLQIKGTSGSKGQGIVFTKPASLQIESCHRNFTSKQMSERLHRADRIDLQHSIIDAVV